MLLFLKVLLKSFTRAILEEWLRLLLQDSFSLPLVLLWFPTVMDHVRSCRVCFWCLVKVGIMESLSWKENPHISCSSLTFLCFYIDEEGKKKTKKTKKNQVESGEVTWLLLSNTSNSFFQHWLNCLHVYLWLFSQLTQVSRYCINRK